MADILQNEDYPLAKLDDDDGEIHVVVSELAMTTNFRSPTAPQPLALTEDEKIDIIADRFRDIMEVLGLDLNDPSLCKTPERVARMYVREAFAGLNPKNFPSITLIEDRYHKDQRPNMVLVKASFCSFCEHHFVPIHGTAQVAYIPNGKLLGLSKVTRVVRYFARRPQIQERLTAQIADSLAMILDTAHIAVSINATHDCMVARGVEDSAGAAITQVLRGDFEDDDALRLQFFESIRS